MPVIRNEGVKERLLRCWVTDNINNLEDVHAKIPRFAATAKRWGPLVEGERRTELVLYTFIPSMGCYVNAYSEYDIGTICLMTIPRLSGIYGIACSNVRLQILKRELPGDEDTPSFDLRYFLNSPCNIETFISAARKWVPLISYAYGKGAISALPRFEFTFATSEARKGLHSEDTDTITITIEHEKEVARWLLEHAWLQGLQR